MLLCRNCSLKNFANLGQNWSNYEETYALSKPIAFLLNSQDMLGDIKDKELKWSQKEKACV